MYEVKLSSDALEFYQSADPIMAKRINRCLEQLEREPRRHNNVKRLTGPFAGLYRFRIGDWRVIYRINEIPATIFVIEIAHRRNVYE